MRTTPKLEPTVHRIGDDLSGSWLEVWVEQGLATFAGYLDKHAAFQRFLDARA